MLEAPALRTRWLDKRHCQAHGTSAMEDRTLREHSRPRVAVVGGGLVGASAAFRLLRRGASVVVLDAATPGQSTAAGAGLLPPTGHFVTQRSAYPLLRQSRLFYPALLDELAQQGLGDVGFATIGALHVALDPQEEQRLELVLGEMTRLRAEGYPHIGKAVRLTGQQARRRMPVLAPEVRGAVFAPEGARIDGRRLLAALQQAAVALGAQWQPLRQRACLHVEAGRTVGVVADGSMVEADAVLLAAGAWTPELVAQLGGFLPVEPVQGQLLHLRTAHPSAEWPMLLGFGRHYALPFEENRIVIGATRQRVSDHRVAATAGGLRSVLEAAHRLTPGLDPAQVLEWRVGLRPALPDGLPALGRLPATDNVWVATGHGSYGLETGPYSGAAVADWMLGEPPAIDFSCFAPGRFACGGATP